MSKSLLKDLDNFLNPKPVTPLNPKKPVTCVWKLKSGTYKKRAKNLAEARAMAIAIIGLDDRKSVRLRDPKTKESRGKVGLYAGSPYWQYQGKCYSLRNDGRIMEIMYGDW